MSGNLTNPQVRGSSTAKLWVCSRCGAKLIARNLSHACGAYSVEKFLEGKSDIGRDLFKRFVTLLAQCGPYEVAPAKTRVAFMATVRFASVNRVGHDSIDVHLVLPRKIESPRFRRVEHLGKLHVHHLRLRDRRDFDRELAGWLRQSSVEYGRRGWLMTKQRAATVGVAEHGSSAVLVTVGPDGKLLDRRRIDIIDRGLPAYPHHHEGSWAVGRYLGTPGARVLSLTDAVALVERVRASAARGARESLEAVAATVPVPIATIAIRACRTLPPTIEERIADNRAQTVADSVMYREALATAAEARGWSVRWYDRDGVFRDAAAALGRKDVDAFLHAMGRSIGPPWQAKHKLAAAAALAATGHVGRRR